MSELGKALTALKDPPVKAMINYNSNPAAIAPHPALPADTLLWAALQRASGGTWAGCVYDVDRIVAALEAGLNLSKEVE